MAKIVREVMNPELLQLSPGESAEDALLRLLAFKVSGAPVVEDGMVIGVVSWRDLVGAEGVVHDFMSAPALTITGDQSVESAALLLAHSGHHRVIVVESDEQGLRPVGVVSILDVVRGLTGVPVSHPDAFPHLDRESQLHWSDDAELNLGAVREVAESEGVVVLVQGGKAERENVVWAEASENVRRRLAEILGDPERQIPHLAPALRSGRLRFRVAEAPDITRRMAGLKTVLYRARDARRAHLSQAQKGAEDARS